MGMRQLDYVTNIDIKYADEAGSAGVVSLSGAMALTYATAIAVGATSLAI